MKILTANPGRRAIAYFALSIVVGAVLLSLPVSSASGETDIVDALFTATSAVCVTGLTVVDTGTHFSRFGQIVILALIQLGGIGMMVFATMILTGMGMKLSLNERFGISERIGGDTIAPRRLLWGIVAVTAIVELGGAVSYFVFFVRKYPLGEAAFHSVFHAVSAFCNAGFSTFSDSLVRYDGNLGVLGTTAALVISGGLGFAVIYELARKTIYRRTRLSLHAKMCLSATAVLLIAGAALFFAAEHQGYFRGRSLLYGISNSLFQSTTCRTAGFNAIPQRELTEVGILLSMLLMLIGACPGSTGGGLKTTTVAVLLIVAFNRFRGRMGASVFRRSISTDSIRRAITVVLLSTLIVGVLLTILMFLEQKPVPHSLSHGWFVDNVFEVISAFCTVGLSLGRTGFLDAAGKVVVIVLMFIGRVGMLSLAFALTRGLRRGQFSYAEESVMVG